MAIPACPRCGYDLSGAVAVWQVSCPLTSVCSECGLRFEWARVLNPALTAPRWSFEHAIDGRIRRLLATWVVALLPWVFWRQLRMEHEISPRRLLIFAAVLALFAHFTCAMAQGWETYSVAIYSVKQGARFGIVPDEEPWVSAALAALWPYRTHTIEWAGADVDGYGGPFQAIALCLVIGAPLAMLLLPDTFKMARVRRLHILRGAMYGLAAPAAAAIVIVAVTGSTTSMRLAAFGAPLPWASLSVAGAMLAAMIWYVFWWWLFTRRYLQLPHAWLVAILILILAALLAVTVAVKVAVMKMHALNY